MCFSPFFFYKGYYYTRPFVGHGQGIFYHISILVNFILYDTFVKPYHVVPIMVGHGGCCQRSWSWCCRSWVHRKRKWPGMPQTFKFEKFSGPHALLLLNLVYLIYLQVRFELTFFALNPELNVVAPWREWDIQGREDAIEYAKKHNVPVPVTKKSIYSRDRNLWHLSHEVTIIW